MPPQSSTRKARPKGSSGKADARDDEQDSTPECASGCCSLLHGPVNLSDCKRMVSVAAGSILISTGLRRRTLPGLALIAIGAMIVRRGVTGYCPLCQMMHEDADADESR